MEKLKQEDFEMQIVKDLMEKKNGKRIALFKCNVCHNDFVADVAAAKFKKQKVCKNCLALPVIFNDDSKTLAKRLFSHTRYNALKRGMSLPVWKNHLELEQWLVNQEKFSEMIAKWKESGYEKDLTPSIDRLDNSRSYDLDNIELVTWSENNKRGKEHLKKVLSKGLVSVFFSSGEYINTYSSISEAERDLSINNLNKTLDGERKQAGGCYAIYEKEMPTVFEKTRMWASTRGLYSDGDPATQMIKMVEEIAELGNAILKCNQDEIVNALGDCCIVLTNLAAMYGINIEECIQECQEEIGLRQGKMINGTFVKGESLNKYENQG